VGLWQYVNSAGSTAALPHLLQFWCYLLRPLHQVDQVLDECPGGVLLKVVVVEGQVGEACSAVWKPNRQGSKGGAF
jgi:hypothetical protein